MKIFRFLIIASLISAQSFGDDNGNKKFKFSKVMAVPDLTFLNNVYTGLDILEQMDFEPLKNKKRNASLRLIYFFKFIQVLGSEIGLHLLSIYYLLIA